VISVGFSHASIPSPEAWHETVSPTSVDPSTGIHLVAKGMDISPGFLQTLGIPLLGGRKFDETADQKHPRIAIVSSSLAERLRRLVMNTLSIQKPFSKPQVRCSPKNASLPCSPHSSPLSRSCSPPSASMD